MTTVFGVLLLVGGIAVLVIVRPWRAEPDYEPAGRSPRPARPGNPRPRPRPARQGLTLRQSPTPAESRSPGRSAPPGSPGQGASLGESLSPRKKAAPRRAAAPHHRMEAIPRGRRVPPEPGREEIVLPDWLGPLAHEPAR